MSYILTFVLLTAVIGTIIGSRAGRRNQGGPGEYDRGNPYASPPPVGTGRTTAPARKPPEHKEYERREVTRRGYEPAGQKAVQNPGSFAMTIDEAYGIPGRGVAVTGRVSAGSITKGAAVTVREPGGEPRLNALVVAIEVDGKLTDKAQAGDETGVLLDFGANKGFMPNMGDVLTHG